MADVVTDFADHAPHSGAPDASVLGSSVREGRPFFEPSDAPAKPCPTLSFCVRHIRYSASGGVSPGMTPKTPKCAFGEQTPECWPESAPYKFFDDCTSPMERFFNFSPRSTGADARLRFDCVKPCDSSNKCSEAFKMFATGDTGTASWQMNTPSFGVPPTSGAPMMIPISPQVSFVAGQPQAGRDISQVSIGSSSSDASVQNPVYLGAATMPSVSAQFAFSAGQPQVGRPASQLSIGSAPNEGGLQNTAVSAGQPQVGRPALQLSIGPASNEGSLQNAAALGTPAMPPVSLPGSVFAAQPQLGRPGSRQSIDSSCSEGIRQNAIVSGAAAMPPVSVLGSLFAGQPQVGRPASHMSMESSPGEGSLQNAAVHQAVAMPVAVAHFPACGPPRTPMPPCIQVNLSEALPATASDRDGGVAAPQALAVRETASTPTQRSMPSSGGVAKANTLPAVEASKREQCGSDATAGGASLPAMAPERKQLPMPIAVYVDLTGLRYRK